jgi:ornithine cyclodeaminase/alanine dehydrogenase-like protein (mu-crystallin family)
MARNPCSRFEAALARGGRESAVSLPISDQNVPFVQPSEQASHNGDLAHAVEAGLLRRDDVSQLGDVLPDIEAGRKSDSDITIFDSTGLAIQDLAIAVAAMEHADELDLARLDL